MEEQRIKQGGIYETMMDGEYVLITSNNVANDNSPVVSVTFITTEFNDDSLDIFPCVINNKPYYITPKKFSVMVKRNLRTKVIILDTVSFDKCMELTLIELNK